MVSTGKYPAVRRYVRKLRGSQTPEARVMIQTAPGEEAQVDYGTGPMVRDPLSDQFIDCHDPIHAQTLSFAAPILQRTAEFMTSRSHELSRRYR
jgi:hypothetical protein